jgi:hypothetical protein
MASAELSVERVVGYPPFSELSDLQRREFHEALLEAESFEDLPGRWQAAIQDYRRPLHDEGTGADTEQAMSQENVAD